MKRKKFGFKGLVLTLVFCLIIVLAVFCFIIFGQIARHNEKTKLSATQTNEFSRTIIATESNETKSSEQVPTAKTSESNEAETTEQIPTAKTAESNEAETTIEFRFPSALSTEGMSPEELAALESRMKEDGSLGHEFDENGHPAHLDPVDVLREQDPWKMMKEDSKQSYKNTVKQIELGNGSLTIGRNLGLTDALYLNPVYESDDGRLYGFQIGRRLGDGMLETSTGEYYSAQSTWFNCDSSSYIADRTYDSLLRASYKDETDYGIRWFDQSLMGVREGEDKTMYIRVIDLMNDNIIGTAKLEIVWDSSERVYTYGSLEDADAIKAGTVDAAKRKELIDTVIDADCADRFFNNTYLTKEAWIQQYEDLTQIEEIVYPYNEKVLGPDGFYISYNPMFIEKLYAVTLIAAEEGDHLTVYVEEYNGLLNVRCYEPYHLHSHQNIAVASPSKEKLFLDYDELVRQWGK